VHERIDFSLKWGSPGCVLFCPEVNKWLPLRYVERKWILKKEVLIRPTATTNTIT